jgi:hypothetical protein
MESKHAMILATERLLRLCWECPDDNRSTGYWGNLERLQKAIEDLEDEDFHYGFAWGACPQDHDSAIGTPDSSIQHPVVQEEPQDPYALTVEEGYNLPPAPVEFYDPPLPEIDCSGWDDLLSPRNLLILKGKYNLCTTHPIPGPFS